MLRTHSAKAEGVDSKHEAVLTGGCYTFSLIRIARRHPALISAERTG
jgi:hypothetical protein